MILSRPFIALFGLLVLAGCSTLESRIKDSAKEFGALDPKTQEQIKAGVLDLGYSERMAWIVLGGPDEISEKVTDKSKETTWIYLRVRDEYAGSVVSRYQRVPMKDPKTGAIYFVLSPIYSDVYRQHEEERLRVIFTDGKISAIEQEKKP